jgi:hypothetical protein
MEDLRALRQFLWDNFKQNRKRYLYTDIILIVFCKLGNWCQTLTENRYASWSTPKIVRRSYCYIECECIDRAFRQRPDLPLPLGALLARFR